MMHCFCCFCMTNKNSPILYNLAINVFLIYPGIHKPVGFFESVSLQKQMMKCSKNGKCFLAEHKMIQMDNENVLSFQHCCTLVSQNVFCCLLFKEHFSFFFYKLLV